MAPINMTYNEPESLNWSQSYIPAPPIPGPEKEPTDMDTTEAIISIIMEVTGYERDEIEPHMDLREDLAIRSSRLPVIMDAVESHFSIKIELEDFMDVEPSKIWRNVSIQCFLGSRLQRNPM